MCTINEIIYSTEKLKNHVEKYYNRLKKIAEKDCIYEPLDIHVHFGIGVPNGGEGTYVYSDSKGYHYCVSERGKIDERVTKNIFDITYWIVDFRAFIMAFKYEVKNRVEGQDFRRIGFCKKLQLLEAIGEDYKKRAEKEINETLKRHPYID